MTPDEYRKLAARTLKLEIGFELTNQEQMLVWCAIGLGGEAGEVLELFKKGIFHQHPFTKEQVKKELGDVLWYVAAICSLMRMSLEDVMELNINKLKERYPDGFNTEDSIRRIDTDGG